MPNIRLDKFISERTECFAGLGSGIVKLTRLTDNNRSGTNN